MTIAPTDIDRADVTLDETLSLAELLTQGDETAARRTLRGQIARLERLLDAELADAAATTRRRHLRVPLSSATGPRVLDLGELEGVRDALAGRLGVIRDAETARARAIEAAHARLDAMLADPAAYPGVTITAADLGEDVCRRWKAVPVLGVVGRLAGWWRVRVSSGCP